MYDKKEKKLVYYNESKPFVQHLVEDIFLMNAKYEGFINAIDKASAPTKCAYSSCSIMSTDIPMIVLCGYHVGLRKTLDIAGINYKLVERLSSEIRKDRSLDWIQFSDGYLVFRSTYTASLLLNGLKVASANQYSIADIDNKGIYLEMLDDFGGRLKADGLDNAYDLMMDPITVEV